jgi:hypothetical protein
MTKENRSQESARQRENRLNPQIGQGHIPCTNDLRFLLIRRASRLDTEDLQIVVQRIRELAAQELAERQGGQAHEKLQQTDRQNNF